MTVQPATQDIVSMLNASSPATLAAWLSDRAAYSHRAHETWAPFRSNPLKPYITVTPRSVPVSATTTTLIPACCNEGRPCSLLKTAKRMASLNSDGHKLLNVCVEAVLLDPQEVELHVG